MLKILAIARLFVKSMVRSGLFITLAIVLAAMTVTLPFTIKGDGTAVGWARVAIYYNFSAAEIILAIVSLWTACGAIAREINEKQIQLVICKPVTTTQVWLGKWFGMLFMNAALLCIAGIITSFMLLNGNSSFLSGTKPGDNPLAEILTARRVVSPEPPEIEKETQIRLQQYLASTNMPDNESTADVTREIRKRILAERGVVSAGRSCQWSIKLPRYANIPCPDRRMPDGSIQPAAMLKFNFGPAHREAQAIKCSWTITAADGEKLLDTTISTYTQGDTSIALPEKVIAARSPLTVVFINDGKDKSNTVVFDPDSSVELLIRESSFGANIARGLIIIFCQLAMLAALGLAVSSALSLPVASFTAITILLIGLLSHYLMGTDSPGAPRYDHEGNRMEGHLSDRLGETIGSGMQVVISPLIDVDPVALMSDGLLVSWALTGKAILLLLILYPAILGAAGSGVLRRRQLALPEE